MALSDAKRCTATAKSTGERCKNPAVQGYSVCRFHGAGSPKQGKPGGRPVTTGRHSKWLPSDLRERYEAGRGDPDLLALKDEIAVLDVRIAQVGQRLATGENPPAWTAVKDGYQDLRDGVQANDAGKLQSGIKQIGRAIAQSDGDQDVWVQLYDLFDQRRRLVDGERKLEESKQQYITAQEMMTLVAALLDIIRRHVQERDTMAAISAEIRSLIANPAGAMSLN